MKPPRIAECPDGGHRSRRAPFGKNVSANAFEVHIVKLHVEESLLTGDASRPHIDPQKWRPLIMSFCLFFGVESEAHPSRLAESNFTNFCESWESRRKPDKEGMRIFRKEASTIRRPGLADRSESAR